MNDLNSCVLEIFFSTVDDCYNYFRSKWCLKKYSIFNISHLRCVMLKILNYKLRTRRSQVHLLALDLSARIYLTDVVLFINNYLLYFFLLIVLEIVLTFLRCFMNNRLFGHLYDF